MAILLIGCTGFIGEALIYKFMTSTNHEIIIVMRQKNKMSIYERSIEIFKSIRLPYDSYKHRIKLIEVNYNDERNIIISKPDKKYIQQHTTILVNALADLNMNRELKKATLNNTVTALKWMKFFKRCPNASLYLYISTCFVNFHTKSEGEIPEKILETNMGENTLSDIINNKTKSIGDYENSYVFTKQLTEILLNRRKKTIKLAIIRPSIVIPALEYPYPGWGKLQTISYAILGTATGILSLVKISNKKLLNTIPVDLVANDCVSVIQEESPKNFHIRHCCLTGNVNNWFSEKSTENILRYSYNYFTNNPVQFDNKKIAPYKIECKKGLFHIILTVFFQILKMIYHCWLNTDNILQLFKTFYKKIMFTYSFNRHLLKFADKNLVFKREVKENDIQYPTSTFEECYYVFTKNLQLLIDNDDSVKDFTHKLFFL